jgi:hypothetical protein
MRLTADRGFGTLRAAIRRVLALSCPAILAFALAACATNDSQSTAATGSITPTADAKPSEQHLMTAEAKAPVPEGKARLLLNRPGGLLYAGVPARVKVGDNQVASLWGGSTAVVDVPAGTTRLSVDSWNYPGEWADDMTLAAGQTYKIEVGAREDGVGTAVMFGAIGGAFEASSNATRSGLFQLKIDAPGSPVASAAAQSR